MRRLHSKKPHKVPGRAAKRRRQISALGRLKSQLKTTRKHEKETGSPWDKAAVERIVEEIGRLECQGVLVKEE